MTVYCGDGEVNQTTEQCDDGNNLNGDGCDEYCQDEVLPPTEICEDLQIIDFESVDCSLDVSGPISIGSTSVLLQVGTPEYTSIPGGHSTSPNPGILVPSVPLTDGQTVNVGSPAEAFRSNGNDDQPEPNNDPNNKCFFSDTTTFVGSDPNRGGSNSFYYLTFDDPITSLNLDLYDYADDTVYGGAFFNSCNGGTDACNIGAVATLTAYANADFTGSSNSDTFVVDDTYVDGQIANLDIPFTSGVTFLSATLTFSAPDIGTGIDNIAFCEDTTPPAPYCGDGNVDAGETCDDGVNNGQPGYCLLW
jgi:cysteine-rich repeat protein